MNETTLASKSLPIHIYLGGSFDPVHNSHVAMLVHVYEQLQKKFIDTHMNTPISASFLPTARSPFKTTTTSSKHRLAMLNLVCELLNHHQSLTLVQNRVPITKGKPEAQMTPVNSMSPFNNTIPLNNKVAPFGVDEYEIWQTPPCYTIDTLTHLRQRELTHPLVFVMGADSAASLTSWRQAEDLVDFTHLWIIPRNMWQNRSEIVNTLSPKLQARVTTDLNDLKTLSVGRIYIDTHSVAPISSSEVRQALAAGQLEWARRALPAPVYDYICKHHLYGTGPTSLY